MLNKLPLPQNFPEYLLVHAQFPPTHAEFVEHWALTQRALRPLLASRDHITDATWFALYAKGNRTPERIAAALTQCADTPVRHAHVLAHEHRIEPLWDPVIRGYFTPSEARAFVDNPRTPKRLLEVLATSHRYEQPIRASAAQRLGGYYLLSWLADASTASYPIAKVRDLLSTYADWYCQSRHMGNRTCEELLDRLLDRNPQYLPTAIAAEARAPRLAAARCINLTRPAHARQLAGYRANPPAITPDAQLLYELYANPAVDPALARRFALARAAVRGRSVASELTILNTRLAGRTRAVTTPPELTTDSFDLAVLVNWAELRRESSFTSTRAAVAVRLAHNPDLGSQTPHVADLLTHYHTRHTTPEDEYTATVAFFMRTYPNQVADPSMRSTQQDDTIKLPAVPGTWRNDIPRPAQPTPSTELFETLLDRPLDGLFAALYGLRQPSTEVIDTLAANRVCPALGTDPTRWELFFTLGQTFAGTLPELLEACVALAPRPAPIPRTVSAS